MQGRRRATIRASEVAAVELGGVAAPVLVEHLFSIGAPVQRWVDTDGRPLYESKSPREVWPPAMSRVRCRYADARSASGLPMNVSALAAVTRQLPLVLDMLVALRGRLFGKKPGAALSLLALGQMIETSWNIPYCRYFVATAHGGEAPALPPAIAALFKVAAGLGAVLRPITSAIVRGGHSARSSITTEVLLAHVAQSGALVGANEVCAAPLELIGEVVRVALVGEQIARTGLLEELVPDVDDVVRFARVQHDLSYWLRARATQLRGLLGEHIAPEAAAAWLPWWTRLPSLAGPIAVQWDGGDRAHHATAPRSSLRDDERAVRVARDLSLDRAASKAYVAAVRDGDRRVRVAAKALRSLVLRTDEARGSIVRSAST